MIYIKIGKKKLDGETLANSEKSISSKNYKSSYDIGPRPMDKKSKEFKEWKKKLKKARKELRADLKAKGITSATDFEQIAMELGLTLEEDKNGVLAGLLFKIKWLVGHVGVGSIYSGLALLLAATFLASTYADHAGSFTVNLTADMLRSGFTLSEEVSFENSKPRLRSEETKDINNISIDDIDSDVDNIDGSHNGKNYVAYTFYIKNSGEETKTYKYDLNIKNSSLGVDEAVWLMLFEDGHQVVYAKQSADGDPERLYGFDDKPPFYDLAFNTESQYYQKEGSWGISTTPYKDDKTVVSGYVENVEPGGVHKYTVVIWLEGNDPECTNDIFGGHAIYSIDFDTIEDENKNSIFDGVWRTEYDDFNNISGVEEVNETNEVENTEGIENREETENVENVG